MTILGIDPGYDRLGWGVVTKTSGSYSFVSCGIIQSPKTDFHPVRLETIHNQLLSIISKYHPDLAVVEKLFFANNAKTAMNVAEAKGVILLACQSQGLEITELTPPQIKSAVTGDGQADKRAVEKMVRLQLKGIPEKLFDDTLDALAAALSG